MSEAIINVSPTSVINIEGIYAGHSFTFQLEQFADDGITPLNFAGSYKLIVCAEAARKVAKLTLTNGDGLTVTDNKIIVDVSKTKNILKERRYYYDLIDDIDATNSYPVLQGTLKVNASR